MIFRQKASTLRQRHPHWCCPRGLAFPYGSFCSSNGSSFPHKRFVGSLREVVPIRGVIPLREFRSCNGSSFPYKRFVGSLREVVPDGTFVPLAEVRSPTRSSLVPYRRSSPTGVSFLYWKFVPLRVRWFSYWRSFPYGTYFPYGKFVGSLRRFVPLREFVSPGVCLFYGRRIQAGVSGAR
jgi:hypothetical protein